MEPKLIKNVHISAGALIFNELGELLMIDRLKPPFGWACPAGHVDEGELPIDAIKREVKEETGLDIVDIFDLNFSVSDSIEAPQETCSRGIDFHFWSVFDIVAEGMLIFKADEVKAIRWVPLDEVKNLKLEPVWKYWLEKAGVI